MKLLKVTLNLTRVLWQIRRSKHGRGVAGKMTVFGILKRGGKVYIKAVVDTKPSMLMPIITSTVAPDSVSLTDVIEVTITGCQNLLS